MEMVVAIPKDFVIVCPISTHLPTVARVLMIITALIAYIVMMMFIATEMEPATLKVFVTV